MKKPIKWHYPVCLQDEYESDLIKWKQSKKVKNENKQKAIKARPNIG